MRFGKALLILLGLVMLCLFAIDGNSRAQVQRKSAPTDQPVDQQKVVKLTIATIDPTIGPPTQTYRLGQKIPVTINLTNTSDVPIYSCLSGDLYQDLPRLKRDGKVLPYTSWQTYVLQSDEKNQTCLNDDLLASTLLAPHTPTLVDSLIVTDDNSDPTGALAWYDQLSPGHYELSIQRRFNCCDGPMVDSNTISFDVVP